jgi:hypothetical protein
LTPKHANIQYQLSIISEVQFSLYYLSYRFFNGHYVTSAPLRNWRSVEQKAFVDASDAILYTHPFDLSDARHTMQPFF